MMNDVTVNYDLFEPLVLDFSNGSLMWNETDGKPTPAGETNSLHVFSLLCKGTVLLLIILLTIGGNLLVLIAVIFNKPLRSPTNCFLVNLAIADLLLGVFVLPFSASLELLSKKWMFGQIFCNIWAAVDVLCCTASIVSLCVISVDRYIGVTRPLAYSSIVTHGRAITACIFVWLLSIAISIGPLFGWKEPPPENPYICEVTKQSEYVLFSVAFSFYIPTLIILGVYFRIYKAAIRQTRFLETGVKVIKGSTTNPNELTLRVHGGSHQAISQAGRTEREDSIVSNIKIPILALQGRVAKFRRQKKAAKTLGIVVGVFILCWFPFFFILPLSALCKSCKIPDLLFDIFFWTGYVNSCLNFIIYACSSRDFKRAFNYVLTCQGLTVTRASRRESSKNYSTKTLNFSLRKSRRASCPTRDLNGFSDTDKMASAMEVNFSPSVSSGRLGFFKRNSVPSDIRRSLWKTSNSKSWSSTDTDC